MFFLMHLFCPQQYLKCSSSEVCQCSVGPINSEGVRGPQIGPTLGTLSSHLVTYSMSRLCCAPHPSYSSPFIVVRSLWTAAAFSCSFFFIITHIHLCIPAANLVPMADGLGLRVVSTALRLRAYYISLSTAPIVVYSAAEVSKVPQLDINLVSGHLHSPHRQDSSEILPFLIEIDVVK